MARKFQVEIEMGNDAMQTTGDIANAVRCAIYNLDHKQGEDIQVRNWTVTGGKLKDRNGNVVGNWRLTEK